MEVTTIIIAVIIVIAAIIIMKKAMHLFSAFLLDYVVDFGLSTLDNVMGGFAGLDLGDLVAAGIIFYHERKITGGFWAAVAALEAFNFIIGSIPIIGEPFEIFFNLCPTVTILRFFFSREKPARKKAEKIEKEMAVAKEFGIPVPKKEKELAEQTSELIKHGDYVDSLKEAKEPDKWLSKKILEVVDDLISQTQGMIQRIAKSPPPTTTPDMIMQMKQAVETSISLMGQAKEAFKKDDFEGSINSAYQAKQIIIKAVQEIMSGF